MWCIIFLYLMSYFAECISWVIVGLVQIGLFVASALTLFQYNTIKSSASPDESTMKLLLGIGITCGIVGVLFLVSICCMFNSLKIAIDVIDASADFLAKTKRVILVPVLYFFVNLVAVLVWLAAFISVTTMKIDKVEASSSGLHQIKTTTESTDESLQEKVFYF